MATGDDGDRWLLDTVRAVSRAVAEETDATGLCRSLPEQITAVAENRTVWIGHPGRSPDTIRIRSASDDLPDRVPGCADELTRRAVETGQVQAADAEECPVSERLTAVSAAETAVVVPLPSLQHDAVLHLYTDGDRSRPRASETLTDIRDLLNSGFDRRETERNLARERDRLEALRSLVSHDLGNPINIAAGRLDLVRTECDSDHIDHVESALQELEALADEGSLFVKAGRQLGDQSELDLAAIAEECWETVDGGTLDTEPATVYAEPERLRMLLNQLFDNAVVHADAPVTVTVGPLADERGFYVADDGPGIPADEREYVFDRGYTTDPDRDGHGLAIVAEIAEALGWRVDLAAAAGTRVEMTTTRW